jgi:2-polyprenyl-3-methyl-5-hydroxy-6-metoxy-1,4-benzoquinol methylase
MDEHEILDSIANDSWYNKGVNAKTIHYSATILSRYLKSGDVLELGPAEGELTSHLVKWADNLTVVDGSSVFCEDLKKRFPEIEVIHSLFEKVEIEKKFDFIVLGHVLEHVDDPVLILKKVRHFLKPTGKIFAAVPNARSIHRQAAVLMGILDSLYTLNETDIHHGHKRVYNTEIFREHFINAGFQIEVFGGYWLKPVSNNQTDETWNDEMIDAFMQLGEQYPDIAGEIYVLASK